MIRMDARGTGFSEPRLCPDLVARDVEDRLRGFDATREGELLAADVRVFHDRLIREGLDVSGMSTADSVADLDALRTALRIETWDIWATSSTGRRVMALIGGGG